LITHKHMSLPSLPDTPAATMETPADTMDTPAATMDTVTERLQALTPFDAAAGIDLTGASARVAELCMSTFSTKAVDDTDRFPEAMEQARRELTPEDFEAMSQHPFVKERPQVMSWVDGPNVTVEISWRTPAGNRKVYHMGQPIDMTKDPPVDEALFRANIGRLVEVAKGWLEEFGA